MKFKLIFLLSLSLLFFVNCRKQAEETKVDSIQLIEEVSSQVNAFYVADTSKNAQGVIDLIWPEFTMIVDGNRIAYNDVKEGTKSFMASLEIFHTEWQDLKIIPLGESYAISSFIFIDSIVAKDGTVTQARGPNTFVWEKRNKEWRVLYGDADHYPIK